MTELRYLAQILSSILIIIHHVIHADDLVATTYIVMILMSKSYNLRFLNDAWLARPVLAEIFKLSNFNCDTFVVTFNSFFNVVLFNHFNNRLIRMAHVYILRDFYGCFVLVKLFNDMKL